MATPLPAVNGNFNARTVSSQPTEEIHFEREDDIVTKSSALVVEQNADDAADYWSPL